MHCFIFGIHHVYHHRQNDSSHTSCQCKNHSKQKKMQFQFRSCLIALSCFPCQPADVLSPCIMSQTSEWHEKIVQNTINTVKDVNRLTAIMACCRRRAQAQMICCLACVPWRSAGWEMLLFQASETLQQTVGPSQTGSMTVVWPCTCK